MVKRSTQKRIKEVAQRRAMHSDTWGKGRELSALELEGLAAKEMNTNKETDPRTVLEQRLKNSYFICAGGAWQSLWESESKPSIGFGGSSENGKSVPTQEELRDSIRPELLKRFRTEITVMKPMSRDDYDHVAREMCYQLPEDYREHFKTTYQSSVEQAVEQMTGMRFFEEILSATLAQTNSTQSIDIPF